jgi:hypothetical protein
MGYIRALYILCMAVLIWGCDETSIVAPVTEPQAIVGQVISDEINIEVQAWQAQLIKATMADSAGYFVLDDMPVGIYEIRITTPSGRELSIKSVTVGINQTTSLKEIRLTAPSWPLYAVYPSDSTKGVQPLSSSIRIVSTQPIDLFSLDTAVVFVPAAEGTWQQSSYSIIPNSYYQYWLSTNSPLDVATQYTFKIKPGLTFAGGQIWEDSLETIFWTDSLRVTHYGPRPYSSSVEEDIEPRRDFSLYFVFNTFVDPDSLGAAVTFTPPLAGLWLEDRYYQNEGALKFFHTGDSGLKAEHVYQIHVAGDVPLAGAAPLGRDLLLEFTTAPIGILRTIPEQGGTLQCSGCSILLTFNTEMDSSSMLSAFALESASGDTVSGDIVWYNQDEMRFNSDSALISGGVYVARVDTTAQNLYGERLKKPYTLHFRAR